MSRAKVKLREFLGDNLHLDGRMIQYRLVTAWDYLLAKGMSVLGVDSFVENHEEVYRLVNQVMALKQACFLLRRTSHSCGSLSEDLYTLKLRLIQELAEKHNFIFDDAFVERNGDMT